MTRKTQFHNTQLRAWFPWLAALGTIWAFACVIAPPARAQTPAEHLLALVQSEDLQKIGTYLAQPGVGINDRPGDVKSLLDFAAERNSVKVAQYLLDQGAEVNTLTPGAEDRLVNRAGVSPLCRAAYFNAIEVMELLLSHGATVNSPAGLESPLICAAVQGNLKAVQILVEHRADINHEYGPHQTAINAAISKGHVEVARYLASHGATLGPMDVNYAAIAGVPELLDLALASNPDQATLNSALAFAAANGRTDEPSRQHMLASLLARGADPDAPQNGLPHGVMTRAVTAETASFLLDHGANTRLELSGYDLAVDLVCTGSNKVHLLMVQMLVARGLNFTAPGAARINPISCAAEDGATELINYLAGHGVSVEWPDSNGYVPIFHAQTRDVIEDLVKHGANLNETGEERLSQGGFRPIPRLTPLSVAIEAGQWDKAALLLSMGAQVREGGSLFLAQVALRGPPDLLAALLNHGVDVNAGNERGDTALMAAVRSGLRERAQLLFDHGADVNARNRRGQTSLHLAVEAGNIEMVKLLLAHGADRSISYDQGITPLVEARAADMRQLLADRAAIPADAGPSARDKADCATALTANPLPGPNSSSSTQAREPGEDWDYLDGAAGDAVGISIAGRSYLRAVSTDAGYLARIDGDGIERIVCEYEKKAEDGGVLRPLTDYERLQDRARRDFKSVSFESLRLQGVRGAAAILQASHRSSDPVPVQMNSDANLLGEAAQYHRDDILAYYLEHGVDANLGWLQHKTADGGNLSQPPAAALFVAVRAGSDRSVDLLLAHGADPDVTEPPPREGMQWDGAPAVAEAVLTRAPSVVEALLAHGANPDIPPGYVPPSGLGIYRVFHNTLGGEVNQWVNGIIFNPKQPAHDLVATATVMFRHGAAPDPWLYTILADLQIWAHGNQAQLPDALKDGVTTAPQSEQVRQVVDGMKSSHAPVADLLEVALRYRDAPACDASTAPDEIRYCLPKSLHLADADLNARFSHLLLQTPGPEVVAVRTAQRAWIRERDKACGVHEIAGVTETGWLAYVLSDSLKAQCVVRYTRERVLALVR